MKYNGIEINVLVKNKPITEYPHNGSIFLEGRERSNFEIEIVNHNGFKTEAVLSVDGVSVIDGKDAGWGSAGYLLEANERLRVPGWKLNDQQVAAFVFGGKADSYSTHVNGGNSRNNGVIGLLAYKDASYVNYADAYVKAYSPTYMAGSIVHTFAPNISTLGMKGLTGDGYNTALRSAGICASVNNVQTYSMTGLECSSSLAGSAQNLGTGFGETQAFETQQVSFKRGDIQALIQLYYDDARGLRSRGIQLGKRERRRVTQTPVAFPGMNCAPPPNWRG